MALTDTVKITLDKVDIPTLIKVVYTDIIPQDYLIHADILSKNEEFVSLSISPPISKLPSLMRNLLNSYGVQIEQNRGYIYFKPVPEEIQQNAIFTYTPQYRSLSELLPLLDSFSQDPNSNLTTQDDMLVFSSNDLQIQKMSDLLKKLDTPLKQVNVRAYVYEVSHSENDNSNAIKTVFDMMSINLNLGIDRPSGGNNLKISIGSNIDVIFNAFSNDSRFNVLSSPSLLITHNKTARFTVGTETPVLSGVTFTDQGNPVQSVEYRRSGVIFDVTPKIYGNNIDIQLAQQVSTFVNTTTGVETSPTLLTRELDTNLTMQDGDLVVMAGLRESRNSRDETYLPFTKFRLGTEKQSTVSDIVLFLYAELVDTSTKPHPHLLPVEDLSGFLINLPGQL